MINQCLMVFGSWFLAWAARPRTVGPPPVWYFVKYWLFKKTSNVSWQCCRCFMGLLYSEPLRKVSADETIFDITFKQILKLCNRHLFKTWVVGEIRVSKKTRVSSPAASREVYISRKWPPQKKQCFPKTREFFILLIFIFVWWLFTVFSLKFTPTPPHPPHLEARD